MSDRGDERADRDGRRVEGVEQRGRGEARGPDDRENGRELRRERGEQRRQQQLARAAGRQPVEREKTIRRVRDRERTDPTLRGEYAAVQGIVAVGRRRPENAEPCQKIGAAQHVPAVALAYRTSLADLAVQAEFPLRFAQFG